MCLAIPGKVLTIEPKAYPKMGTVNFGGVKKSVCLEYVPDVRVGEYVIVHVGFAISKLDEKEAEETLRLLENILEPSGEESDALSG